MMKRNISSVLLAVALISGLAAPACADAGDFNRPGPYVGLAVAGGLSEFQGRLHGFGDSAGFSLRGGYRFNDYLAAEGLYEYMDEFGGGKTLLNGVPAKSDFLTHNFSLMGKVILPTLGITKLQPYLSAGVGFLNANGSAKFTLLGRQGRDDASGTEFAGRVDGGFDLFLTPAISTFFDLGYVMPTSHLSEVTYLSLSLGAKYSF